MVDRTEYLLAALRVASMRAKLYEIEINSIGVALRGGFIGPDDALAWVRDIGADGLMVTEPDKLSQSATVSTGRAA